MMEYVVSLLAFAATFVAIFGDTWDAGRKGLRKITGTGYAVASVALVILLIAWYQAYDAHRRAAYEERIRNALREQALAEVYPAVHRLAMPWFTVLAFVREDLPQEKWTPEVLEPDFFDQVSLLAMRREYSLGDEEYQRFMARFSLSTEHNAAYPVAYAIPGDTWAHIFEYECKRGFAALTAVLTAYGPFLNLEDVRMISALRAHPLVSWMCEEVLPASQQAKRDRIAFSLGDWLTDGLPSFSDRIKDLLAHSQAFAAQKYKDNDLAEY